MPLFHIHGLVAGLLAPLSRGGAVVCTPGFNALSFLTALADSRATWFTAVPTMHQAILMRCGRGGGRPAHGLRFARSSSAPLPARLTADFESAFGVPLLESYGMTEAAHQIAANTLAGVRKPGSVGPAAGAQVAAIDEAGRHLPADAVGASTRRRSPARPCAAKAR